MYNFDAIVDRRGSSCLKWDKTEKFFGKADLLPLWVADMDFATAPGVTEMLKKRVEHAVYGYSQLSPAYYEAVVSWMERRHHWQIQPEWICYTSGVVSALYFAVECLTEPGDEVMLLSPVYGPFYASIEKQGRKIVDAPLFHDGVCGYGLDLAAMERAVSPKTKALIFCSPHNPVGRVWTRQELEQVVDFCKRHDLYIIDDEIHNDLVYDRESFTTLGRLGADVEERSIICTAITKTFNLADLQVSNIIIPNAELRQRFQACLEKHHVGPHSFSEPALLGAYEHSEGWLEELLLYIKGNMDYFCRRVEKDMPLLQVRPAEGSYLLWVNCGGLGFSDTELRRFFVEECGLAVNAGTDYGARWGQFVRFNMACPRSYVQEALDRLEAAIARVRD